MVLVHANKLLLEMIIQSDVKSMDIPGPFSDYWKTLTSSCICLWQICKIVITLCPLETLSHLCFLPITSPLTPPEIFNVEGTRSIKHQNSTRCTWNKYIIFKCHQARKIFIFEPSIIEETLSQVMKSFLAAHLSHILPTVACPSSFLDIS